MGSGGLGQVKWVQNRICEAYPSGGRILDICLSTNTGLKKYIYIITYRRSDSGVSEAVCTSHRHGSTWVFLSVF